jgi:hypothetical protein
MTFAWLLRDSAFRLPERQVLGPWNGAGMCVYR